MKSKYHILILLTIMLVFNAVFAVAQASKKPRHKPAAKKIVKTAGKPKPAPNKQKVVAKDLGDAVATTKTDTTKNAGVNNKSLDEEIVVTTAYKPVLADAVKIRINPNLEDKVPFKAPLTYTPIDNRLEQNTDIKQIEAIKRSAEQDSDIYNNYLKLGLGNLKTTYGEAYFNNGQDEALQFGAYLKHFAQDGNLYKQNSNKEDAGAFIKSIGSQNSISGHVDYHYYGNYFYGFNPALLPPVLNVDKQYFSTIHGEVELAKNYRDVDNDFTYAFKLNGYLFNNAFQAKESNLVLSGFLNETVKQFYAGVSGTLDLSTQQDSLYNYNNSLIRVNPYLKFQGESYKIDAGINIVDEFGFASSFRIFPAAKLEFQVIPKYVRLFAELRGDINKSSLLDFSTINPFLEKNIPIENSIDQLDIAAGLKGTILPQLGFKFSVYRNSVKDMPLFVSNFNFASGYNRFTVVYDNGTSTINGFNGELDFKASQSIDIFGNLEFKQYEMADNVQPWNLPTKKLTGGAIVHLSNTVNVKGAMVLRGSALDPYVAPGTTMPVTVNAFADLSGGVEYKASKRISIFVNVNNILNTSNQTWLYYPDYGFNVFGGASLRF